MLACDNPGGCGGDGLLFHLADSARDTLALIVAAVAFVAFLAIVAPAGPRAERAGYVVLVLAIVLGGGVLLQNEMA
jgi:hypothetical protein